MAVRSTRLSNRLPNPFDNRFDNRLYRVNGALHSSSARTWNTSIGGVEVGSEVWRTRSRPDESGIRHTELARVEAGARRVQVEQNVDGTAEMSVVLGDAAADLHAAEHGRVNDDYLARKALRHERLRQAVDLAQHRICETRFEPGTEHVLADISRSRRYVVVCTDCNSARRYVVAAAKPDCKSAQQRTTRGHPLAFPKLHPGPCSSVGIRRRTDRQTHRHRDARDQYTFRVVYDSREM